ncbi:DUF3558 domain-containing protein [Lentzea sp.]|uniref:DUF3558 domain-containing protein n=1 Tax=Lentzea sp. TaxID=56099 RepID=UPI002C4599CB|nr:DUF3558 domain-containing protein [Lentzea sp.]HUQ58601.1 DUF3558 domain-containing protein [Lentzea sp.]
MAVLAAMSACTNAPGTPRPESASTTPPVTTTSKSARPREVKLDGRDACQLLTAAQLPALKINGIGRPVDAPALKAKGCSWTDNGASIRLVPVTIEGIDAWTSGKKTGRPTEVPPVEGFAAITVTVDSDPGVCDVLIDTADGQYLAARFSVSPSFEGDFPKPCDGARALAEAAMENLLR